MAGVGQIQNLKIHKCERKGKEYTARPDGILGRAFLTKKTMNKQELQSAKAFINAGRVNRATSKRALEILRQSNCGISRVAVYRFLNNEGAMSKYQSEIIAAYNQAINERMDNPGRNKIEKERTIQAAKRLLAMAG